ncbi:Uncharacterised protein [Shigella sonnei]|nr:Uncharacterised protein [Shigella sonnei]
MFIERLKTITFCAFHTSSTGIPAIGLFGSSCAAGLTVSLAPITSTVSVSAKSSLISSISSTMSYGTFASASNTFICPGKRPATGWIPKRTLIPRARSFSVISATGYCACATAMPYPGVMITEWEFFSSSAVSSAVISRCSPTS